VSRSERIALGALALASLVFRGLAFFRYRFDSDEPQHLHVAWGWTAGLVQYRDLFDNHAPLFHLLSAPLLGLVGERPDVLLFMRAPMLLLWAIVLGCTYVVSRRLYSTGVALWATLLLAVFPPFFLKSIEYRTDNFWMALWMLVLVMLTTQGKQVPGDRGPEPSNEHLTRRQAASETAGWQPALHGPTGRLFAAGLLLGLAICVSLKTTLLIATLLQAAVVTHFMTRRGRLDRLQVRGLAAILAGMIIAPLCIAAWFIYAGAWPNLVYCVFEFNKLVAETHPNIWLPGYPAVLAAVLYFCWSRRGAAVDEITRWRYFFGAAIGLFISTLGGFWILISPRDFLPVMPLFAMFIAAALERTRYALALLSTLAIFFLWLVFHYADHFHDGAREHITMMNQVIGLTRPGEPLMDLKGETIYRRRPFYYIFEYITRAEIEHGFITDKVAESVIAARCHVAQADGAFFPPKGREFLSANFVDVGRLRASGQFIDSSGAFTIGVAGDYVIVGNDGEAKGALDGTAYQGVRTLTAGPHRFIRAGTAGKRLAVFWAPAYARGYSPFHPRDRDF
jgi:hypothetical protein